MPIRIPPSPTPPSHSMRRRRVGCSLRQRSQHVSLPRGFLLFVLGIVYFCRDCVAEVDVDFRWTDKLGHAILTRWPVERWFRGGLVFKAHRLVYLSTLGLRVLKKTKKAGPLHLHQVTRCAEEGRGAPSSSLLLSSLEVSDTKVYEP